MTAPRELILPSSGTLIKDDFLSNDAVADAVIGELSWELDTIGTAATFAFQTQVPHGVLRLTTASNADGDGHSMRTFTDGLVLEPGFEFGARIRYPVELATLNFRIGLDDSVTATRPTVGVTVESAAGVITCANDSADSGDESLAVNNAATGLTSGTTLVVGEWLDIKVLGSGRANSVGGPDHVDYWMGSVSGNGPARMVHVASLPCGIDNDEEVECKIVAWQTSGGADAVAFEIDYYYFWQPRI